jgi:zinc transporter ZupT
VEIVVLALAGTGTALATGLGALPVSRLGDHADRIRPALWGLTVGLMSVASIVGLLLPALDEGSSAAVAAGLAVGVVFLLLSRRALEARDVHVGQLSGAGVRRSVLVFAVLLVHSLPEGFAIGTAFASETEGLGLFVILAIALQNVPEGTSVAIPMDAAGFRPASSSGRRSSRARRSPSAPSSPTCWWRRSTACCRFPSRSRPARCSAWLRSSWPRRRSGAEPCGWRSRGPLRAPC